MIPPMTDPDELAALVERLNELVAHHERLEQGAYDCYLDEDDRAPIKRAACALTRLSEEARALREALAKAHEAAEISECRIAEVYDYIVKARDAVNGSAHLASGVVPRGSLSVLQDIFEWLQKAKYGLGGRTNVAGSIAELTRAALARAKGETE